MMEWSKRVNGHPIQQVCDFHQALLISGVRSADKLRQRGRPEPCYRGVCVRSARLHRRLATPYFHYVIGGLLSPLKREIKRNP